MKYKPFTMTANTETGSVTFGILGRLVWVRADLDDGTTLSSIDNPVKACAMAAFMVDVRLWPAFATHLRPDVHQATLFETE